MVYCVQAYLIFADDATRDSRLAQAQSQVGSKNRWNITRVEPSDDPDPFALIVEARFVSKNDQTTINNLLKGNIGQQPGSWVRIHDCDHDEAGNTACVRTTQTVTF